MFGTNVTTLLVRPNAQFLHNQLTMKSNRIAQLLAATLAFAAIPFGFCETEANRMTYVLPSSAKSIAIKVHLDRPTEANPMRKLWLERGDGQTELIWQSKANPNWTVLPRKPSGLDEYSNATILAANCNDSRLIVLFEFRWNKNKAGERINGVFQRSPWFESAEEFAAWDGRIQFLRTFVRDKNGAWRIELSAFPQTLWKSVLRESAVKIVMYDDGKVSLVYAGAWKVVPDREQKNGVRKESGAKEGETAFSVVFDEKSQLLLTVDETGRKCLIGESQWWLARDEWDVSPFAGQVMERDVEEAAHQLRAKEAGINLANNERF